MKFSTAASFLAAALLCPSAMSGRTTTVSGSVVVTNLAPEGGTCLTPVWIGLHDGSFDIYNRNEPASPALESLAEDGDFGMMSRDFAVGTGGRLFDGAVFSTGDIPPICPGQSGSLHFSVEFTRGDSDLYLSYATMVLPSNDAFLANGDPKAHMLLNKGGQLKFDTIVDNGSDVLDAGTEVNDEIPMNTAFFGQSTPNTGVYEGGVIDTHPGFLPVEDGGILASESFANADFKADGYKMMKIEVYLDDRRALRGVETHY